MGFSENLQYLRKQHKITQEQLAEALAVSRQSVSKWESGGAYPETEKLLALCDMFSCTLDQLMRGEVQVKSEKEAKEYDRHMHWFAKMIAAGVGMGAFGVVVLLFLRGIGRSDNEAVMALLMFAVISITLFIVGGVRNSQLQEKHKTVERAYSEAETDLFNKRFIAYVAGSVALFLIGLIFLVGSRGLALPAGWNRNVYISVFLLCGGIAASVLVYAGIVKSKFTAPVEEETEENELGGAISGVIMMIATAAFLLMGFLGNLWNIAWIVFPVGGILCGAVSVVTEYQQKKGKKE